MSNFDFFAGNWAELARMGELAEQYLYSDTNKFVESYKAGHR